MLRGAGPERRWLIQRQIAVNAKSASASRMAANLDVFDFELTDDQMDCIATLDTGTTLYFDHRDSAEVSRLGTIRVD